MQVVRRTLGLKGGSGDGGPLRAWQAGNGKLAERFEKRDEDDNDGIDGEDDNGSDNVSSP